MSLLTGQNIETRPIDRSKYGLWMSSQERFLKASSAKPTSRLDLLEQANKKIDDKAVTPALTESLQREELEMKRDEVKHPVEPAAVLDFRPTSGLASDETGQQRESHANMGQQLIQANTENSANVL